MSSTPAVRSMTGFARVSHGMPGVEFDIEVRSVNHRFLEVYLKAPRSYAAYERDTKAIFQRRHRRGRIDVSVVRRVVAESVVDSPEQAQVFDRLVKSYSAACKRYGAGSEGLGSFLAQIILREQASADELVAPSEEEVARLLEALDKASEALALMREVEGTALAADISKRLTRIEVLCAEIARGAQEQPQRIKELLEMRIAALAPEIRGDPQRLAFEVALLADRVDISEELARLGAHITHFSSTLIGHADGIGRKLDFIIQEIGRELNTVGSKAQDARIQGLVVDAKAELERIREQVQNVE